ncbi:MAG: carbohydrate-binding domain-containing protein, partial [Armatimonadota bacterium]|nr:carbohydrate-binding domain-containing protein [Armatimonadota bacterium]
LVAQGKVEALLQARAEVESLLRRGGAVLLHRPTREALAALRPLHGSGVVPRPHHGPVLLAEGGLFAGAFAREDLYWLGVHAGVSWATTPLATDVAEFAFFPSLDESRAVVYDARAMRAEGAFAGVNDAGAYLASSGTITGEIEVPQSGAYVLGLVARSTPAAGVFAAASVALGGTPRRPLGTITTASREWDTYTLPVRLPAGRYPLVIAFINDAQIGGEDRNFYLQKVLLAPASGTEATVTTATVPPALCLLPERKGRFYVDSIRWDTEEANAVKAARFACALLSALGGELEERVGVSVEAESMEPSPGMPHFRRTGTAALLAANGYIETEISVARAGTYRLEVIAQGTAAQGVYPLVEVWLDDQKVGTAQLLSGTWRAYPLSAQLSAGKHRLRLAFVNDLNREGEDRNLQLDKVIFYAE